MLCNHRHCLMHNTFILQRNPIPLGSHSPFLSGISLKQTLFCFLSPWICLFWIFPIYRLIQYVAFCAQLPLLSIMFLWFMEQDHIYFYSCIIFHCVDIHHVVSIDGCLGCFHLLTIMNHAAISSCGQILFEHLFSMSLAAYLEWNCKSYGNSILYLSHSYA